MPEECLTTSTYYAPLPGIYTTETGAELEQWVSISICFLPCCYGSIGDYSPLLISSIQATTTRYHPGSGQADTNITQEVLKYRVLKYASA